MVVYSCIGSVTWILSSCEAKLKNGDSLVLHADVSVVIAAPLSCLSHSFSSHAFAFFSFFFNLDNNTNDENQVGKIGLGKEERKRKKGRKKFSLHTEKK